MENKGNEFLGEGKSFQEVEMEIKGLVAANKMLSDYQKESRKQNKRLTKIIALLVILMFLEGTASFGLFVWYESQFEYAEGETITTTETENLTTEGDNANINKVEGDQYNDNAVHNVSGNN